MGNHLLLEDMAEVSGGICGHATDEQSKDQVHGLSQHMMVPAPVDAFNGLAAFGFLARSSSFLAILFF
jgi:hypothetical protein